MRFYKGDCLNKHSNEFFIPHKKKSDMNGEYITKFTTYTELGNILCTKKYLPTTAALHT